MRPLHLRFARGYQIGLVIGVLIGAGVWFSTQSGLDAVQASNEDARIAAAVALDAQSVGATLGQIEDAPESLVLRADLARHATTLRESWTKLAPFADQPDDVRGLLSGSEGLAAQVTPFLDDVDLLAGSGAAGADALDEEPRVAASRLEGIAFEIADRVEPAIRAEEALADRAIADARTASHLLFVAAVGFLLLLVGLLLRPLRKRLELESAALTDANLVHQAEARRQELATHLSDGLEAAETEGETNLVVGRAFAKLIPDHEVEMLISPTGRGALTSAVVHPVHGGPGCTVDSTRSCPAVRRGRTMTYDDSAAINACPHLTGREGGARAATCVPISFMGESMGVLHATHDVGESLGQEEIDLLGMVASQVSIRLGTLRSFAQVEMQASIDPLTGLPNRRATEDRLRRLLSTGGTGSIAMADFDHFELLNDRHGHDAGDRALRMFAEAVREALRGEDWIGRWGGEEFLFVLPGMNASEAVVALDRVRGRLADACDRAETPAVTVSMGVVDTSAASGADELVRLADDALLAAKTQGRDRVVQGPVLGSFAADAAADDPHGIAAS
ncbi:MAG: sensor domain-containing diguanylate cyclase [Acidimicrobiales bacterium]